MVHIMKEKHTLLVPMSNFTGTIAEVLSLSHCVSDSGVHREHAGGESTHLHWKEDHVCSVSPRIIKKTLLLCV